MKAPRTFTTGDIVEINSHGGIATTNKVLELLLNKGIFKNKSHTYPTKNRI